MSRDWHEWYRDYDDPTSSLSLRLAEVRSQLASVLSPAAGPVRLLSLCSGDGRDTLPVLASAAVPVSAVLVELDATLASSARRSARELGLTQVEVRTADAGDTSCASGAVPADVVMACGIFGNVSDADVARTVGLLPTLLASGGVVIWTRGSRDGDVDPADVVRGHFDRVGFDEVAFVRPDDQPYRVGVHRWPGPSPAYRPGVRMFSFV